MSSSLNACVQAMKWVLVVFNVLILCAGGIAIGLGAWGLASEYGAEKMRDLTGTEFYRGGAIAIIVGGSIMVVIAFLGILGAVLENRVLLGIYFTIVLLLLILFVVAVVVAFVYRDELEEDITSRMTDTVLYQYGVNLNSSKENRDITNLWDDLQKNLHCCGVKGRLPNSSGSWFLWQKSKWFEEQKQIGNVILKYVPESCCNTNYPDTLACTSVNTEPPFNKPVQLDNTKVTQESDQLYYKGCYDQFTAHIREHILAIGGIALAIVICMFLSLLFAICVCANIRSKKMIV
ncbi:unnamed protein product [Candidula unifasciata]|uniref:Tetraspanin n=1 Tax=Candidula unifasciata TaxID=100452 RepID=A0A8S3YNA1_9EUPU|nr:unnamed protein product [Candidula unifasciata]